MRSRLAVPVAALLGACALVVPQAAAQTCGPPSAEHAFEELLDIAADDSPLEDEAWRIADEQEGRKVFETPETLRMIDELARSNDLTYDCAARRYVPLSHPDPRDAIENDQEPVYEGPTGVPGGTVGGPGQPGAGVPGVGAPGGGRPGPVPAGPAGPGAEAVAPEAVAREDDVRVEAAGAGSTGRGTRGRSQAGGSGGPAGGSSEDLIGAPADIPDGAGGAVALPGSDDSPTGTLPLLAAGCAVALIVTVGGATVSARRRPRRIV